MLLLWALGIYGITQIVAESSLTQPIRNALSKNKFTKPISKLLNCVLCTSVWVSVLASWFIYSPSVDAWSYLYKPNIYQLPFTTIQIDYKVFRILFFDGMIGSTIVWFLHIIENRLLPN